MLNGCDAWFMREVYVYHAMLKAFFVRRCRQAHQADDLCQETYLRMLRAYSKVKPVGAKALLFQTAMNLLIDMSRREIVKRRPGLPGEERIDYLDPERQVCGIREFAAFRNAVADLPSRRRQVLWMRRVDNAPVRAIASQLGIQPHTVEEHVRRAVRFVRTRVAGGDLAVL